ncbi:MAG: class I SAM-dependent methyltransferase [Anaerolineales bacterium]|nr:class I SAM-dependent methyltransferase [Anaerolineales bacterium]
MPWFAGVRPVFATWLQREQPDGRGRRAAVVGCGLGDDAEALAALGFAVTAFDIAPSAVAWCKERFPQSSVEYVVADLFALPTAWRHAFDFVLEIFTIQSLPVKLRKPTIDAIATLVAPGGELLVIAVPAEPGERRVLGPPWPLTRPEIDHFQTAGLQELNFEALDISRQHTAPKWRAYYQRRK